MMIRNPRSIDPNRSPVFPSARYFAALSLLIAKLKLSAIAHVR